MAKPKHDFVPPSDPDDLITWAQNRLECAATLDEFRAKENLAFMLGDQWGVWNKERKRFQTVGPRRGDPNAPVRIKINKIGGLVERSIARLTKSSPEPECRPVTDTQADINAARVGTRILSHEMDRLKFTSKLVELYFWAFPLGWSFFHVRWDPKAGPAVGELDGEAVNQGEILLEEVPAFEMKIDPNARRFRDARWCIRSVAMTKEAVFEQYGIVPTADSSDTMASEWRINTDDRPYTSEDFVTVNQLWLRPGGRTKPEGLVFTWCGKTVLEKPKPFPYEHGLLPFEPLNILPAVGGDPCGRTWVTDLIDPQKDYNDSRSREATIRRTLTPKVLAAVGQIDPNRLSSRLEVVQYNPTGPIPRLELPDARWATQFEQGMDRADAEMGDRSGQQEVSQGKAASSAPAASILALQEADETKLAISAKELASCVQGVGHQILMLVKQFWDEERTVRTWSRDGELEVSQFSQSDIANQLDVHVSSESALPKSKSARTQMATDFWAQGIITDPVEFVRMLEMPGTDFLVETLNRDAKQAEREHGVLIKGEQVEVKVWENHEAHWSKHQEFRKSEEYEQLPPEVQAVFDAHCDIHMQVIAQKQMAMAQGVMPMPDGSMAQPSAPQTTNPTGENGEYTNPLTGAPQDPLAVAAGQAPSSLAGSSIQGAGGIGGVGQPGPVPGVSQDTQAMRMGN